MVPDQYTNEFEAVNLTATNFKFAFAVENFRTKELLDDPRHVRWIALIETGDGKNTPIIEQEVNIHKCTEEDYA
jgi:hypothetical protein